MDTVLRGMRTVVRNPMRLLLVVLLLGASLMLVAAMVSLNGSAQQQLTYVHTEVGTAITVTYATNESVSNPSSTGTQGTGGGQSGQGKSFERPAPTPVPNSALTQIKQVPGVASVEASLRRSDDESTLTVSPIQTPNGRSISVPPTVNGISTDATHFTLAGGSTPTLVAGRTFQASDANASVAMMSQALAQSNNLSVGSQFTVKGSRITLIGLYTTDQPFANNSLVLPIATMQKLFAVNGVDSITVYAKSYEQVNTLASKLKTTLGNTYSVVTEASTYATTIDALNTAENSIKLGLIIAIATATLVIIFTVFLTVRERTIEIGTLKAIGASHWQVIRQFWGEVLTLSLAAALIAVVLLAVLGPVISQAFTIPSASAAAAQPGAGGRGFGGGRFLFASQAANLNVHLSPARLNLQALLIIVGLGMGLAVLASVIPVWYVSQIKPAEVLRRD